MDARQHSSKSALTKFHKHTGSLPQFARPVAFELRLRQLQRPVKGPNNPNPVKEFVVCTAKCSEVHPW